ncbi:MAG: hypothetical protein CM15mP86_04470 [Gammaproteobacteria bacterium]|nr:MAG: hypothetical protein CM15mP86_04470 [Gammaproteobacteria bacterium]
MYSSTLKSGLKPTVVAFSTSPTIETKLGLSGIKRESLFLTGKLAIGSVFNFRVSRSTTILPGGSSNLNLVIKLDNGTKVDSLILDPALFVITSTMVFSS